MLPEYIAKIVGCSFWWSWRKGLQPLEICLKNETKRQKKINLNKILLTLKCGRTIGELYTVSICLGDTAQIQH